MFLVLGFLNAIAAFFVMVSSDFLSSISFIFSAIVCFKLYSLQESIKENNTFINETLKNFNNEIDSLKKKIDKKDGE